MKRLPAIFALCALAVIGVTALGHDRTPSPTIAQGPIAPAHAVLIAP
jgi:hypothetical protein